MTYEFGSFRLDASRALLLRDGEPVALPPKAFETLLLLLREAGRVLKKEEFIAHIWPDCFVEEGNLTQNVFVLRKTLGEGPHDHRYIVTVPGQGYRFVAPVRQLAEVSPMPGAESTSLSPEHKATAVSIAVLPFKNLGDKQENNFLGSGLADALITRLSGISRIAVCSTTASLRYADSNHSPLAAGRELGVETVLAGYFQRAGGRIRVTVQLFRLRDGKTLWADKFDESLTDVFSVQDSISEHVVRALVLIFPDE